MFPRMRIRPARWAVTATALVLAGGAMLVVAEPAYAEQFPFTEGFEGVPDDRWTAVVVAGQTSVRLGNDARARSRTKVASLNAGPLVPSTATIYRTVAPDDTRPYPLRCHLQLFARRVRNVPGPDPQSVEIFVKTRLGGPTGRVILSAARAIYLTESWEQWDVGTMSWPRSDFTIEIAAYHGRALIDDLSFTCGLT